MRIVPLPLILAAGLAAALTLLAQAPSPQAPLEPRNFKPARVAVVSIAEVFQNYAKKKDMEAKLMKEGSEEEKRFDGLIREHKAAVEELKNVQEGTERYTALVLKKTQLELNIKDRQNEVTGRMREKHRTALEELRREMDAEIRRYAEAMELDMVLQKDIDLQPPNRKAPEKENEIKAEWPIVHYVKPELDITGDIIKRLNAKYGGLGPSGGGGEGEGAEKQAREGQGRAAPAEKPPPGKGARR